MGISQLTAEKLLKTFGAERVSEDAKKELIKILEKELFELSIKASKIARYAKKKTITDADIIIAKN